MPTITVHASGLEPRSLRKVAVDLTRWCRDAGIDPSHVVVRASEMRPGTVLVGGMPPNKPAVVTCEIGVDRDDAFVEGLTHIVTTKLQEVLSLEWILVRIERRTAKETFVFDGRHLASANQLQTPETIRRARD